MQTRSLALALVITWALTGYAHEALAEQTSEAVQSSACADCGSRARAVPTGLTFDDGFNEGWAEINGPQFLLPLSLNDIAVIRRALAKLEDEHIKYKDGIDDYLMGRRARILEKLDTYSFIVLGSDGTVFRWITNPELTMIGFAVSRDRYCRAEDQDTDNEIGAAIYCKIVNSMAIELFDRIKDAQHMMPGGAK